VVKESIDVLRLLRKRGVEGDVDFLREALASIRPINPSVQRQSYGTVGVDWTDFLLGFWILYCLSPRGSVE